MRGTPFKEPLIKASSAASWSFPRLFEPLFPHLSSNRLRKSVSKIHRNCLRFRRASFNQRLLKKEKRAFSLVEVTISIGIVAFALVLMLGLLPTGLNLVRDSSDESTGINILTALVSDLKNSGGSTTSTAVYNIAIGAVGTGNLYFDENGRFLGNASSPAALYKVAWTVRARDTAQGVIPNAHLQVGWPAAAATPKGTVESVVVLNTEPAS